MRKVPVGVILQSVLYVASGVNHFAHRAFYLQIMPEHYSRPAPLVLLSGAAEIAGGVGLLLPATRRAAAVGLGVLLVVFLDVHQDMLRHPERFSSIPRWALWARLPLQAVLIGWAWRYARRDPGSEAE